MRYFYINLFVFSATPAFAHAGHLGEVAGHAHWIGLAAALGAAAIAAALVKGKKKEATPSDENEANGQEDEAGETA